MTTSESGGAPEKTDSCLSDYPQGCGDAGPEAGCVRNCERATLRLGARLSTPDPPLCTCQIGGHQTGGQENRGSRKYCKALICSPSPSVATSRCRAGTMGFDDQSYAASQRPAPGEDRVEPNENPAKRAKREAKVAQKELERKTKVGARLE